MDAAPRGAARGYCIALHEAIFMVPQAGSRYSDIVYLVVWGCGRGLRAKIIYGDLRANKITQVNSALAE